MDIPPKLSALREIIVDDQRYTVVGSPEPNGMSWQLAVEGKWSGSKVQFASLTANANFLGWLDMKHPGYRIGMVIVIRGRDYRFMTEPVLAPDTYWHATLKPEQPLAGEAVRTVRMKGNGELEWFGE